MTHTFALLYGIAAVASIVACLPQIIQIIKTQNVEGISLQSYDMWLVLQIISMPYIYQSGDMLWFGANVLWGAYYFAMVLLIQHYRYPRFIRNIVKKVVAVLRLFPVKQ